MADEKESGERYDPTRNVFDLVASAIRRIDDLRAADNKLAEVRAAHAEQLRVAEKDRLDAIRAVDVGAAQILAEQVRASAEALRAQVAIASTTADSKLGAVLIPIQAAINDLQSVKWASQGVKADKVERTSNSGLLIAAAALVSSGMLGLAGIIVALIFR